MYKLHANGIHVINGKFKDGSFTMVSYSNAIICILVIVNTYYKNMNNVDRINQKSRKWCIDCFYHFIDIVIFFLIFK